MRLELAKAYVVGVTILFVATYGTEAVGSKQDPGATENSGTKGLEQVSDLERDNESVEETVSRCLKEMKAEAPSVRRQAVMILGKYREQPKAQRAVIRALEDESADVRRAALVSLTEERAIPRAAISPVLQMLDDPDVHIRRVASSVIPQLMQVYLVSGRAKRAAMQNPRERASKAIKSAFQDEDTIVQENMLEYYRFFKQWITPQLLRPILQEGETRLQLRALEVAHETLRDESFVNTAAPLIEHEDHRVRRRLARYMPTNDNKEVVQLNTRLSEDKNPNVAALAISNLIKLGEFDDWERLKELVTSPDMDRETGVEAIRALSRAGQEGKNLLVKLLDSDRASFRLAALETSMRLRQDILSASRLVALARDSSRRVRSLALRLLKIRQKDMTKEQILSLGNAADPAARKLAVNCAASLPPDEAKTLIVQFLPDEEAEVRREVIKTLADVELPGWRDILHRSLKDPSQQVRKEAVRALCNNLSDKTVTVLRRHHKRTDSEDVREFIEKALQEE